MRNEIKVANPLFPDRDKLLQNIASVLESGRLMNGEFVRSFEEKFSDYLRSPHAVSVNSCTTALEITLRYLGISNKEVIVPTNTFVATANAVLFAGGRPVFADIKKGTYFLDPEEVGRLISGNTAAVIVVHIAGLVPPELEEIKAFCDRKGIPLIEDCAHAPGASYKGRMAGTFGFAGCFSFYPTKIMTTATGGMIVTGDEELAKFARSARLHGVGSGLADITNVGNDWFMDEIRGCLGINQIEHLEEFLEKRRSIAALYDRLLQSIDVIRRFVISEDSGHAYYKYPAQVTADVDVAALKRDFPSKYGFELESIYWPTCHLQPVYREMLHSGMGDFPVAESILSRQITLPVHANISMPDAEYAVECVVSEITAMQKTK